MIFVELIEEGQLYSERSTESCNQQDHFTVGKKWNLHSNCRWQREMISHMKFQCRQGVGRDQAIKESTSPSRKGYTSKPLFF